MSSNKNLARVVGGLLLIVFIIGVVMFQVLQGPVLFSENYLSTTAAHSNQITSSALLAIFNGTLSVIISILLIPLFKEYSLRLAYLYVAFCIVCFIALAIDSVAVMSMLEVSKEYVSAGAESLTSLQSLGNVIFDMHTWTHYMYLLLSCLPVFVFFYTLYFAKLVPKAISLFGLFAVVCMATEIFLSIFDHGFGMNMLLPIGLIQLFIPFWLIIKGFNLDSK